MPSATSTAFANALTKSARSSSLKLMASRPPAAAQASARAA
jgi:hypothetical protein